ncbi:gliding motility-associated ABC transporter substrate-binding protein GldG [Negadavirga shengliensis]|uniref:Gliding motility-associated ABC transporter substrate-binding protein GldG n=1 Tax=Negadavirga shengliensis TaxID=1389218 RepID=A0ABV9T225_9BACT
MRTAAIGLGVILVGWILIYLINLWVLFRIDLTEEKRYSLSDATKVVLAEMEEPLEVEILLAGELPGGMKRFQKSIENTLKTFGAYSPEKIHIYFQDPLELDPEIRKEYIYALAEYGINPTNLHAKQGSGEITRMIFPGIILRTEDYEIGVLLLKGEKGMTPDEILNLSMENLEFEISQAIKRLYSRHQRTVGVIIGQGEMEEDEGFGMVEALNDDFEVYKVPFDQAKSVEDLLGFEALLVAGPKTSYGEREKYLLDQYLMYGGNLLLFIDQLMVDLEMAGDEGTVAMPFDTGLDDLLFRYGIRINRDYIQDLNFGYHPVVAGDFGDQSQIVPLPWPFYVNAGRMAAHPITKGLDQLQFRFVSSIDTVKAEGVRKTPLVFTSNYSKTLNAPVRVAFEDMAKDPEVETFTQSNLPLVYLLEGEFTSYFKNRFLPEGFDKTDFKESGNGGKIVVAGDGNLVKSLIDPQYHEPMPLGLDPYTDAVSSNREFLQNAMQYLTDPDGIIATRNKQFKIRPLNRIKARNQQTFWQVINILLPVAIIVAGGSIRMYIRKRKYTGSENSGA